MNMPYIEGCHCWQQSHFIMLLQGNVIGCCKVARIQKYGDIVLHCCWLLNANESSRGLRILTFVSPKMPTKGGKVSKIKVWNRKRVFTVLKFEYEPKIWLRRALPCCVLTLQILQAVIFVPWNILWLLGLLLLYIIYYVIIYRPTFWCIAEAYAL